MNMNREQVAIAVTTGLTLLGPESKLELPASQLDGIFMLKALLNGIASGQIALQPGVQKNVPPGAPLPEGAQTPPQPPRNVRRAAKKKAAKAKK